MANDLLHLNGPQIQLIKRTVAADTTDSEFNLFIEVARRLGLDPFKRQIHCVVYSKKNKDKRKLAIIAGIDGLRALADRSGTYRPDDEATAIDIDPALKDVETNPLGIVSASLKAFKQDKKGEWFPITGTAYWEEFAPIRQQWADVNGKWSPTDKWAIDASSLWRKMPRLMIAKCAEGQVLRKGWPEDMGGLYAQEEMDRTVAADNATELLENYESDERARRVNAIDSFTVQWEAGSALEGVKRGEFFDRVAEWLRGCDHLLKLEKFIELNAVPLQWFWAEDKDACLQLKKLIEQRRGELI